MKCMVIVKATKDSEKGVMPSAELLTAMGKYNEELIKAGIMQGGGGLKPGRYLKSKPTPLTNLFLSMADRMGVQGIEKHGDSTGRLEAIS